MSLTLEISIPRNTAGPALAAVHGLLSHGEAMHRAAAEGVLPVVQSNFRKMARTERNRFGARSSFWNRMLSGTRASHSATAGRISMPREVALRYFGGTVTPKAAKYLTIPLRAEAYGKSPKQFDGIKFARIGGKLFAFTTDVGAADGSRRSEIGGRAGARKLRTYRKNYKGRRRITLLYLLVTSAKIEANEEVLPTGEEMLRGAGRGVKALMDVTIARSGAQGGTAP